MRPVGSIALASVHAEDRRINVTPLIDVVMVMIVFFLIVGKLASDQRSQIELPLAEARQLQSDPGTLIVNVTADRSIVLQSEALDPAAFGARLRKARDRRPDLLVQIRADRALAYGDIAPVIVACRESGITRIRLATEGSP